MFAKTKNRYTFIISYHQSSVHKLVISLSVSYNLEPFVFEEVGFKDELSLPSPLSKCLDLTLEKVPPNLLPSRVSTRLASTR